MSAPVKPASSRRPSRPAFSPSGPDAVLSVELAPPGTRARKVKTRSKMRAHGAYPSFRMGRMIHWESPGERSAIKLLDVDPSVIHLGEQPCVIYYRLSGVLHRHYPDLLVKWRTAQSLFEVKERTEALSPEVVARTALMRSELPRFGYAYDVLLSDDLEARPRLTNVEFVLRHGRPEMTVLAREELRRYFAITKSVAWSDVLLGQAGPVTLQRACRLILEGELFIDFNVPWSKRGVLVRSVP